MEFRNLTIQKLDLNGNYTLLSSTPVSAGPSSTEFAVVVKRVDSPNGPGKGIYVRFGSNRYYFRIDLDNYSDYGMLNCVPAGTSDNPTLGSAVETTAPSVPANLTSSISNGVATLSWNASTDNAGGIGDVRYAIFAGSTLLAETANTSYQINVQPGDNLSISVKAFDGQRNFSTGATTTITAPFVSQVWDDSRRAGIHSLSSQWGAMGESIDMRSMNLNFSIPLLKPMGRNGLSVPLGLSYNSQLWRRDNGTSYKTGADVGYGFGWRLMAGSVTPIWTTGPTFAYYLFTDATGAEYKLDQNVNNVWSTKYGATVKFDPNANALLFKDGTKWVMGSISGAGEQDAGTRYPTVIQDRNGNQVVLTYQGSVGGGNINTSARIWRIDDIRAVYDSALQVYKTYAFSYSADAIPHLNSISNTIQTAESFTFAYSGANTLQEPFSGGGGFGNAVWLNSITSSLNLTESFGYNSAGELTNVNFPLGGNFSWTYASQTYLGTKQMREVQSRNFVKASGAAAVTYSFSHPTPSGKYHTQTTLTDPSNQGQRRWTFSTASDWTQGFETLYEAIDKVGGNWVTRSQTAKTWGLSIVDSYAYVTESLDTLEPGTANQKQSKTVVTMYRAGEPQISTFYGYDSLTTEMKSGWCNYYYFGLLYTCSATQGSETVSTYNANYDSGNLTPMAAGTRLWIDPATSTRGNAVSWGDGVNFGSAAYNAAGQPLNGSTNGVSQTTSYSSSGAGSTVPNLITPNNTSSLSVALNFNSALNITGINPASENGVSFGYDGNQRKTSDTSKDGATTSYTYASDGRWMQATINGRWTKTTYDGIGRPVKLETGDANGTKSIVETQYEPCACSPVGKMKRTSLPYAPGGSPIWTEYTYDGLGRVVSVAQPNNSGTTTYSYTANQVTVTSPAGRWKTYENNALGQLVKVTEPRPGGGTYTTSYAYNVAGKLTTVTMPRDGYTQTRTFVYDSGSRQKLVSATNPENGTVTYTYNSNGTLATKVDAKNIRTVYGYDALNRTISVAKFNNANNVEDACQRVNYTYNGAGRPATARWGWDANGNPCSIGSSGKQIGFQESYTYTATGRVATKTLGFARMENGTAVAYTLSGSWAYNNEGQVTQITLPNRDMQGYQQGITPTVTYGYDSMGRPLTAGWLAYNPWGTNTMGVTGAQYNAFGAMTSLTMTDRYGAVTSETRGYNALGQLTSIVNPSTSLTYSYSATQNDGKILSAGNVQYQYDELERLISAQTTGPDWGLSFSYDGFGNRLAQTVTKGSAPTISTLVDPSTNRISSFGYDYDFNGNMTRMPQNNAYLTYDWSNRMIEYYGQNGTETYAYAPDNRRVWRSGMGQSPVDTFTFYSPGGQKLGVYSVSMEYFNYWPLQLQHTAAYEENYYFGGRLVGGANGPVWGDRLGSIPGGQGTAAYFPFGEPTNSAAIGYGQQFATYPKETIGLDYAVNRWYSSTLGRFTSSDSRSQSKATLGNPSKPILWNNYAYANQDPVNLIDAQGRLGTAGCGEPGGPEACTIDAGPQGDICQAYAETLYNCGYEGPGDVVEPASPPAKSSVPTFLQLMDIRLVSTTFQCKGGGTGIIFSATYQVLDQDKKKYLPDSALTVQEKFTNRVVSDYTSGLKPMTFRVPDSPWMPLEPSVQVSQYGSFVDQPIGICLSPGSESVIVDITDQQFRVGNVNLGWSTLQGIVHLSISVGPGYSSAIWSGIDPWGSSYTRNWTIGQRPWQLP